ncbi:hypothetical protein ABK040_014717 [Willaertia magna]
MENIQNSSSNNDPFMNNHDKMSTTQITPSSPPLLPVNDQNNNEEENKPLQAVIDVYSSTISIFNKNSSNIKFLYHIKKQLGRGFFGAVYLCQQQQLNSLQQINNEEEEIAIKMVSVSSDRDIPKLKEEYQLIKHLGHENIIKVYHFYELKSNLQPGVLFTMKYYSNGDLRKFIENYQQNNLKKISIHWIYCFLYQMSNVLNFIHSKHIIHRDIKPENIFLEETNEFKCKIVLGDFGLAKVIQHDEKSHGNFSQVGTLNYWSPEIANHQEYGSETDIWSLGCVLYELLTLKSKQVERIVSLRQEGTLINDMLNRYEEEYQLIELIVKMLSKKRETRPKAIDILNSSILQKYIKLNEAINHVINQLNIKLKNDLTSERNRINDLLLEIEKVRYLNDSNPLKIVLRNCFVFLGEKIPENLDQVLRPKVPKKKQIDFNNLNNERNSIVRVDNNSIVNNNQQGNAMVTTVTGNLISTTKRKSPSFLTSNLDSIFASDNNRDELPPLPPRRYTVGDINDEDCNNNQSSQHQSNVFMAVDEIPSPTSEMVPPNITNNNTNNNNNNLKRSNSKGTNFFSNFIRRASESTKSTVLTNTTVNLTNNVNTNTTTSTSTNHSEYVHHHGSILLPKDPKDLKIQAPNPKDFSHDYHVGFEKGNLNIKCSSEFEGNLSRLLNERIEIIKNNRQKEVEQVLKKLQLVDDTPSILVIPPPLVLPPLPNTPLKKVGHKRSNSLFETSPNVNSSNQNTLSPNLEGYGALRGRSKTTFVPTVASKSKEDIYQLFDITTTPTKRNEEDTFSFDNNSSTPSISSLLKQHTPKVKKKDGKYQIDTPTSSNSSSANSTPRGNNSTTTTPRGGLFSNTFSSVMNEDDLIDQAVQSPNVTRRRKLTLPNK